jgi:inosine/xanthosine triphosphate pyrophosphatase family protein
MVVCAGCSTQRSDRAGLLGGIRARRPVCTDLGYDPCSKSLPSALGAQLDPAEKNRISHRGQALRLLLLALQREGGE